MENAKADLRALLPLVEKIAATRRTTMKAAVAEAAAQKGVNSGSLLSCYHRNTSKLLAHGNRLLSDKDEQILVWTLQAFSHHNMALALPLCRSLISKLFDKTPSKPWLAKFMRRHSKELRAGATKQLSKARNAKGLLMDRMNAFAKQAEDFLDNHKLPANAIFNYDEAALAASGNKLALKRINSKNRSRMNSELQRSSSLGSMISFASANGKNFMSVYILKNFFKEQDSAMAKCEIEKSFYYLRDPPRRYYAWNDSGRLNGNLLSNIMDIFLKNWRNDCPGSNCLLFGDNLSAHRMEYAID